MKITEVKVEGRSRKSEGLEVESLVKSISQRGLIHPILIGEDRRLIAGGRRLSALILLGVVDLIEGVHYRIQRGELSTIERLSLELEENTERDDFTWEEEIGLREKIHLIGMDLAREKGESWNVEKSADLIGLKPAQLYLDLKLAKGVRADPSLLKEKDKSIVVSRIRKKEESHRRIESAKIISGGESSQRIILGDSVEEMRKLEDSSIDLMLVDPPFGTSLPERDHWVQKYSEIYGGFSDSKEDALMILRCVLIEAKRVLKTGHYCWIFFSTSNYREVEDIIRETLGGYQPVPALWKKTGNHNFQPFERITVNYEPFFMCWNFSKQRSLNKPLDAINEFPTVQAKIHPAEKPIELYDFLIERSTVPLETILDPFAGSGSSGESARGLTRNWIGIEHSPEAVELIQKRLGGRSL
jgi:DNA modification methylase|tara:strand:+ start:1265 stop:2506 length:1242 start_codon:yes stop_codon:yes gene_type:complete